MKTSKSLSSCDPGLAEKWSLSFWSFHADEHVRTIGASHLSTHEKSEGSSQSEAAAGIRLTDVYERVTATRCYEASKGIGTVVFGSRKETDCGRFPQ